MTGSSATEATEAAEFAHLWRCTLSRSWKRRSVMHAHWGRVWLRKCVAEVRHWEAIVHPPTDKESSDGG